MTNHLDLPSDYFEEDISSGVSNNDKEEIRLADTMGNDDKNIRPVDIDKQRPITLNWTPRNGLLSELPRNFREVTFSRSEFPVSTPVSDTRYVLSESQSNNPFYPFNNQLDYAMAHYFAESETTKCNVNKFLSNLLMELITKQLLYCNTDE